MHIRERLTQGVENPDGGHIINLQKRNRIALAFGAESNNNQRNMTTTNLDPRARFWGNVAKWGLLLPLGFVLAPFIWIAVDGLLGLIFGALVIGAVWMLWRPVGSFAANMRLRLIKAEAKRNPVETLQEDLRKQAVALEDRKNAINHLKAKTLGLADKLSEIKAKWGTNGGDYQKLLGVHGQLVRLHEHRLKKWDEAHAKLGEWAREIERASDIWDAAQAAAAAQESSGLSEDDFFAKIKTETALDSIQTSFNTALASLDTELAMADNQEIMAR